MLHGSLQFCSDLTSSKGDLRNRTTTRSPSAHSARIVPHIVSSRIDRATQRPRGASSGLANQDHGLILWDALWVELGQRIILGPGDVTVAEFVRFANVHNDAAPIAVGPQQLVVFDCWDTC